MLFKVLLFLQITQYTLGKNVTINFKNGESAIYRLNKLKDGKEANRLEGGEAFIRFATVHWSSSGCTFKADDEVVLKIALSPDLTGMRNELNSYAFVEKNIRGKDGVTVHFPMVEPTLGTSDDLAVAENFVPPEESLQTIQYTIIVIEALGMDLTSYRNKNGKFKAHQLMNIHLQLHAGLDALENEKFAHGDVKPSNILLGKNNNIDGPFYFADLSFAVFPQSKVTTDAGDQTFSALAQMLGGSKSSYIYCKISAIYTVVDLGTDYLLWKEIAEDSGRVPKKQKYDLHKERIAVAKYGFTLSPFVHHKDRLDAGLEKILTEMHNHATQADIKSFKEVINNYNDQIQQSKKVKSSSDCIIG